MATVVGTDITKVKRVTCPNCASIIEYTQSETYKVDNGRCIKCPKCRCGIVVERVT